MDPVALYGGARAAGWWPALLESLGPRTAFGRLTLLGLRAEHSLEVWDGVLYVDGKRAGEALDLFAQLRRGLGRGRFPNWIGFLSYEFARRFGRPTLLPMPGLPEAAFRYYPDGCEWVEGRLRRTAARLPAEQRPPDDVPPIDLLSDYPPDEFIPGVEEVQERIRAGWVYQVNLSHRFHFAAGAVPPLACYSRLREANPSPFMGILEGDGWAVVSGSPERLFCARAGEVVARPIAGTRPRGRDREEDVLLEQELLGDRKERAEHVMLVDLLRNDLARVSVPGSVHVSEALTVERYSHVMHLVSEVRGRSRQPLERLVASIFPGGTITGAPKESVMREIARLEPVSRGAYTGSLGYVSGAASDFNILIRSLTFAAGQGFVSGGGGIVIESDPEREYLETRHKVEALLHVLGRGRGGSPPAAPSITGSWRPPRPTARLPRRITFVEGHDSFSYNIIDYLSVLGANVRVVDQNEAPDLGGVQGLVVGPGPGEPRTAGRTLGWVEAALAAGVPLLGVCLGHQALGMVVGARLERAPRPVHGEDHPVFHTGRGVFAGLPSPSRFTRYHSLHLVDLPSCLTKEAWTEDGVVMAIALADRPAWGVQFHPESMLSVDGLELLANYLSMTPSA